jgi:hypothetical protein
MASFSTLLDQSVQTALNMLKTAKGGAYVIPTDAQLITAIAQVIYAQLNADSVV